MLQQVEDVRKYLQNRRLLPEGASTTEEISPEFWFQVLAVDPVTVPQAGGHSAMSIITFKSWDVRSSFLRRFGGQSGTPLYHTAEQPVAGRHVKVSPCAPQWQRKLEAPLRVVLSAVNAHEDWQGMTLTILWKSLTVMKPSQERDFLPDHTAWARLFYEEKEGVFRGGLEVAQELANVLLSPGSAGSGEESLWTEHWNNVIWGNQHTLDQLERESFQQAKVQGHTAGKGALVGKGKKHWSNAILHSDFYSPYPFELDFVGVQAVGFSWDEYCDKLGKPEEKVGSYSIGTYQGKPAVDHTATGVDDDAMGGDPFAEPSAASEGLLSQQARANAQPPKLLAEGFPRARHRCASPSGVASKAGPTPHRFLSEREEPPLKFYKIGAPSPDHTAPRRLHHNSEKASAAQAPHRQTSPKNFSVVLQLGRNKQMPNVNGNSAPETCKRIHASSPNPTSRPWTHHTTSPTTPLTLHSFRPDSLSTVPARTPLNLSEAIPARLSLMFVCSLLFPSISRSVRLQLRVPKAQSSNPNLPQTQPITTHFRAHAHTASPRSRTGRRIRFRNPQGVYSHRRRAKRTQARNPAIIHRSHKNSKLEQPTTPPPRGVPGVPQGNDRRV